MGSWATQTESNAPLHRVFGYILVFNMNLYGLKGLEGKVKHQKWKNMPLVYEAYRCVLVVQIIAVI